MRLGPLRHPWFRGVLGIGRPRRIGDEVARLALPLLILDLTHSIAAAATLRLVQALPYVFFRRDPRRSHRPGGQAKAPHRMRRLECGADACDPVSFAVGVFSLDLLYVIGFFLGTVEVAWG